jgi:hypothetical protein
MRNDSISVPQAKIADIVLIEINGVASTNPKMMGIIHSIR